MMSHVITSMKMGSGSILLNRKPKNGFQGSEKRNTSLPYHMTPNQSNKDTNLISARNSHTANDLNLITYIWALVALWRLF